MFLDFGEHHDESVRIVELLARVEERRRFKSCGEAFYGRLVKSFKVRCGERSAIGLFDSNEGAGGVGGAARGRVEAGGWDRVAGQERHGCNGAKAGFGAGSKI